jgi:hypothetical protein
VVVSPPVTGIKNVFPATGSQAWAACGRPASGYPLEKGNFITINNTKLLYKKRGGIRSSESLAEPVRSRNPLFGLLSCRLDLDAYFLGDFFYVLQTFPGAGPGGFVALLEFIVFTFEYF